MRAKVTMKSGQESSVTVPRLTSVVTATTIKTDAIATNSNVARNLNRL
jgi:hypothetical protein